jgi:adenylate kinase family enzyme
MTQVPDDPSADELAEELRAARAEREAVAEEIAEYGEASVRAVDDAVDEALGLLSRYEDSATGTGDFEAYLELQSRFVELVENLPEDLPERDRFEAANEALDQRTISESDLEHAREAVDDAVDVAALLEEREAAQRRVDDAEHDITQRLTAIEDRLAELERLRELDTVDLSAPTEELTEPITAYDEAVREAFAAYRSEASARELFAFVRTTRFYPLVDFEQPPDDLVAYLESHAVGEESLSQLLTYADYSQSKLDHYVEDTTAFRTTVPVHRTYLDRLDAEPLTVGHPPPTADKLRYRAQELVSVVARFADEETVALARDLDQLSRRDDYDRLRRAAVAEDELTAEQREALEAGDVDAEYERLDDEYERLSQLLEA